ncbi:MAG: UDP-N-acetylglucosamine 1-carboxyvinyltransferase [Bacteroidales bacterium]|nr:UDP-N-acetylglucosamine 1-carboxyvinyltransferase [Bacteroidales bacterium]
MSSFEIIGGHRLKGDIEPQGAKNEALQVICAVLLTEDEVIIDNIPDIRDVNRLIELLALIGVEVKELKKEAVQLAAEGDGCRCFSFRAKDIDIAALESREFTEKATALRGSIMLVGPLLARFGKAVVPQPGGDKIGRRRLDTHFTGMEMLGAKVEYKEYGVGKKSGNRIKTSSMGFVVEAKHGLKGRYMLLDEASVTGTANIVMAAVMAEGETTIMNAACEPYVYQLCGMLNNMGAHIEGVGSNLLKITGVKSLHGCNHRLLPDMIEVGSFIGMAAMTQSDLTIKNAQVQHLGLIPQVFRRLGIEIWQKGDDLYVPRRDSYEIERFMDGSIMTIADAPWPGFTPDLVSIALVVATQCKGSVLIHQKMFESRLFFVDKLIDMGAQIILCDPHRATVIGLDHTHRLRGVRMTSPDIRAGVALLLAALSAEGVSRIDNIEQIDRGYQHIDERLRRLGANIKRIN